MILQFILGKPNEDQVHLDMLPVVVQVTDDFNITHRTKRDFADELIDQQNDEFDQVLELLTNDKIILLDVLKIESIFKKEEETNEKISSKQKKRRK